MTVRCPKCSTVSEVEDTRRRFDNTVERRRECPKCHTRFTTAELIIPDVYRKRNATTLDRVRDYLIGETDKHLVAVAKAAEQTSLSIAQLTEKLKMFQRRN